MYKMKNKNTQNLFQTAGKSLFLTLDSFECCLKYKGPRCS